MTVYRVAHFLSTIIARTYFRFEVIHRERIVEQGPAILAMNHQSFLDPPLAGICCKRDIYFLARRNLLKWPILGPLFPKLNVVPVDQERPDMSALKIIIRLIRAGHCTIIFPEGSRTFDGELQPAQPGLGLVIAKTLAPVVPMRVFGAFEAYPRGAAFPRPHKITISVGHPIHFTEGEIADAGRDAYLKLSQRVMHRIAAIQFE